MATINTIHDLFQLLRDNPEWADELRTLMLTTELIDLPRKFDELVEETRAHKTSFDELVEETRTHNAKTDAAISELRDAQKETQNTVSDLQATVKVIQDDVGELKGSNAINAALRSPDLIVFALSEDLLIEKTLTAQDIGAMLRAKPGIVPQDARMSFVEADLMIHAKDSEGEDHYIAAEVSYTVGSNDVDRAIRNAEFLRRLTDKESHAIVVGNDINGTASMIVEREGVAWYQLRRRDTRPR